MAFQSNAAVAQKRTSRHGLLSLLPIYVVRDILHPPVVSLEAELQMLVDVYPSKPTTFLRNKVDSSVSAKARMPFSDLARWRYKAEKPAIQAYLQLYPNGGAAVRPTYYQYYERSAEWTRCEEPRRLLETPPLPHQPGERTYERLLDLPRDIVGIIKPFLVLPIVEELQRLADCQLLTEKNSYYGHDYGNDLLRYQPVTNFTFTYNGAVRPFSLLAQGKYNHGVMVDYVGYLEPVRYYNQPPQFPRANLRPRESPEEQAIYLLGLERARSEMSWLAGSCGYVSVRTELANGQLVSYAGYALASRLVRIAAEEVFNRRKREEAKRNKETRGSMSYKEELKLKREKEKRRLKRLAKQRQRQMK